MSREHVCASRCVHLSMSLHGTGNAGSKNRTGVQLLVVVQQLDVSRLQHEIQTQRVRLQVNQLGHLSEARTCRLSANLSCTAMLISCLPGLPAA